MLDVITKIRINASPDTVWKILTDLPVYSEWNSFIRSIQGELCHEGKLNVSIFPPNGSEMKFSSTITKIIPLKELRWVGKFGANFIFRGEHYFLLDNTEDSGTLLTHGEKFSGLLMPFVRKSLDTKTRQGFECMNTELAQRAASLVK